jgi:hypothetical protein
MLLPVTLVLPVHNAESWLGCRVRQLLDELALLSRDFEILIVDDGSSDETSTVANELSLQFPQVRMIRQPLRYGQEAAERLALQQARGDFVMLPEDPRKVRGTELHQIWQARNDPSLVMLIQRSEGATLVYDRRHAKPARPRNLRHHRTACGLRMVRHRQAADQADLLWGSGRLDVERIP